MTHRLLVVPTIGGSGATAVCLGLLDALRQHGINVGYAKPLAQPRREGAPDHSTALVRLVTGLDPAEPVPSEEVRRLVGNGAMDDLMELALTRVDAGLIGHDVVVIEGLAPSDQLVHASAVNEALATTFDADVVLVGDGRQPPEKLAETVAASGGNYYAGERWRALGVIVNRVASDHPSEVDPRIDALAGKGMRTLALVVDRPDLNRRRVRDVINELDLEVINLGDIDGRVSNVIVAARSVPGVLSEMTEGTLVVVPGDRSEIVMAAALTQMNGVRLAGLLLSAGIDPHESVMALCAAAATTGLPILKSPLLTYEVATKVAAMVRDIPPDDEERARAVMQTVSAALDPDWLEELPFTGHTRRISPAAFRRQLTTQAAAANKRIVLPEGAEPRTVEAALVCHEKGIARCVLLAPPSEVVAVAASLGRALPDALEVIDPASIAHEYVDALVERRAAKGMTPDRARDELTDTVMLGTMMLFLGQVDGLVSGAVHTTANTVRPALQVLGTKQGADLVSSVFFMCLPDEVVIYGDCAINPDPDAGQLADIAIQSADSAKAFGIEPRVAMISFSTGSSGAGVDVQKVTDATRLVRERRPDLMVDGPLQYDAATMASVARSKAPDSPVAGQATVFIFPDLNTGNTTYKAVQRSAGVVSIGPMLQGISRPVNDLSRGALVDDIVYTIALTAIQAVNP